MYSDRTIKDISPSIFYQQYINGFFFFFFLFSLRLFLSVQRPQPPVDRSRPRRRRRLLRQPLCVNCTPWPPANSTNSTRGCSSCPTDTAGIQTSLITFSINKEPSPSCWVRIHAQFARNGVSRDVTNTNTHRRYRHYLGRVISHKFTSLRHVCRCYRNNNNSVQLTWVA